jgi:hypothetical protein
VACPVSVQERLRGWRCGSFPFGRRPYASSRAQLTGSRRPHISWRGGVLSPRTPNASGMALQCLGWRRGSGDGRTGPMVTEETRLIGPTSWHHPGRARDGHTYPFRALHRPLSRVRCASRTRVGGTVSHITIRWRGWPHREGWRNSAGI